MQFFFLFCFFLFQFHLYVSGCLLHPIGVPSFVCVCLCQCADTLKPAVGILTMDHYVAYIGIIRCLLGNEFVFEADIVAVPNPNDRDWINEHIRPHRPGMYL